MAGRRAAAAVHRARIGPVFVGRTRQAILTTRDCSIMLDNELIVDRGRFTDPTMTVPRVSH